MGLLLLLQHLLVLLQLLLKLLLLKLLLLQPLDLLMAELLLVGCHGCTLCQLRHSERARATIA